jgi:long-chain-fatty-acid--CoA ligase ACSBG
MKKTIADTAKGKALARAKGRQLRGDQHIPVGYNMAVKLLDKVKDQLGLDCCRFGLTGAAPIRVDTQEYFGSLNLQINETYGMSESCGSVTICLNERYVWGSVGFALPSIEVKAFLVDAQDLNKKKEVPLAPTINTIEEQFMGELCFRGRNIMMGYLASPDLGEEHVTEMEKKTAETIDDEGWLHSGDKGLVTVDGMVKITGRYKEIIIGEGGENIAPVPIEDHVKKECDGICEVMMVGDKRKYNVALVTLKAVGANGESPGTDDLDAGAKRVNPDVKTISGAMKDPKWVTTVQAAITSANNNSKCCVNAAFKIQKFTILPTNFSEEANELTPTKKLKRKVVEKAYEAMIEKMYASDASSIYIPYSK